MCPTGDPELVDHKNTQWNLQAIPTHKYVFRNTHRYRTTRTRAKSLFIPAFHKEGTTKGEKHKLDKNEHSNCNITCLLVKPQPEHFDHGIKIFWNNENNEKKRDTACSYDCDIFITKGGLAVLLYCHFYKVNTVTNRNLWLRHKFIL